MGCNTSSSNESSLSKDMRFPKLYKIKRDQTLDQLFIKLQNNLKQLITANVSLNDINSKLNTLLGIYSSQHDASHLIKTLITTVLMQNKGQSLKSSEFKINEKYPFFAGSKKDSYGVEVSQFMTLYKQYISCVLLNQSLSKTIQDDIKNIKQQLINLQNTKFICDEQITYNHTQTKLIQEKVNSYNNYIIKQILEDHKYAIDNYNQISQECISISEILYKQNTDTMKKVSTTLLQQAKTQTSI